MARRKTERRTDYRREKDIEQAGDRLMNTLGFAGVHFSQARATRQTPGIPDRLYIHEQLGVACWWEAKTEIGRQSASQRAMQLLFEAIGWNYVLGTDEALLAWAVRRGYCQALPGGGLRVAQEVAKLLMPIRPASAARGKATLER